MGEGEASEGEELTGDCGVYVFVVVFEREWVALCEMGELIDYLLDGTGGREGIGEYDSEPAVYELRLFHYIFTHILTLLH